MVEQSRNTSEDGLPNSSELSKGVNENMLFTQDIGIDLGTANTLVFVKGKGIVIREPSVVAVDVRSTPNKVVAVGAEAKEMIGRTPGSITAVRPLKDGVIADFDITADMLKEFIRRAMLNSKFNKARPVAEAAGSMVVDIGGGTAEVAVISLGDIVTSCSARVAGDSFDDAIIAYIKKKYNLLIGERTAEEIKIKIGSAYPYEGEGAIDVKGRNLVDGLPKNIEVTSEEVREALADSVNQILDAIRTTLEKTPPELAADIIDQGIMLTGGGALLRGLDRLISAETKMPVHVAENPLDCVVDGTGVCLENDMLSLTSTKNYDE